MGPYCKFCDQRCFVPLPPNTPPAAIAAYKGADIIATCAAGQEFEMSRFGWCYDSILMSINYLSVQPSYTPGPWRLESGKPAHMILDDFQVCMQQVYRIYSNCNPKDTTKWVADLHVKNDDEGEGAANASVLAAAADLLAACKALVNMQKGRENFPEVRQAEAAIAKAEQSTPNQPHGV